MTSLATLAVSVFATAFTTLAQAPPPSTDGAISTSRPWGTEIIVSLLFVGLAVFAVGRRSKRT